MATMNDMDTIVRRAARCQYNVMFLSQPALGKTTRLNLIVEALQAEDPDFYYTHLDMGTLAPTDLVMSMPDMTDKEIRRLIDGRLPNAYKTPDLKGIIYCGEWMLMGMEVNRGIQKLANHEDLGGFRIPEGVIFVADGNRQKDKSGAQVQSRAVMSRFLTVELEYDAEYALEVMKNYHERVAAFAIRTPTMIDNYADVFENDKRGPNDLTLQEGKMGIWASLRSWDRVSRIMHDADQGGPKMLPDELIRNVGSGVAASFEAFCSMLDKLATLEEIVAHPDKVAVPKKMDEQYALSTMLALLVNKDNFVPIATYMQRYEHEIQIVYFRIMNDRLYKAKDGNSTAIRATKEYKKWITAPHITKLLQGASQA